MFFQLYLSAIRLTKLAAKISKFTTTVTGYTIHKFKLFHKFLELKVNVDGPTIVLPETKESPEVIKCYLGK